LEYYFNMSITAEKVITEALSLSPQARAFVAERLIESLDAGPEETLSPAWRDELRKRCREMDEGAVELREAADVFAKVYAALG
jgi:putative addiction module component (TIGR02574 family)